MNAAPQQTSAASAENAGPTILIVDDSEPITRALSKLFTVNGFTPAAFHTGLSALAYIEKNNPPAAAVVDIHLPDLSGLVLTRRLRERLGEQTPIIILSGDHSLATLNSLPHV